MSEEQQAEIALECDEVSAFLTHHVGIISDGRTALGVAMGLMRLAAEMLYHTDDATPEEASDIADAAMCRVRKTHEKSRKVPD